MEKLKALLIALFGAWSVPVAADPINHWAPFISEAAARFDVPEQWIRRVMKAESDGQKAIVSNAGAMGLMQLMPGTWRDMKSLLRLGDDPFDPRDNILAGAAYLRILHDRFGSPGMFAAYNAGPERYARYLSRRQMLPRETVVYVAQVSGARLLPRHREQQVLFTTAAGEVIKPRVSIITGRGDGASLFVALHHLEKLEQPQSAAALGPICDFEVHMC